MKAVGLVVEYNPFHNGHRYHAEQAKISTGSSVAAAVMSGHFLQRGEPAAVSKWARTKMALENGVDLVIELPYMYAVQKAEIFARGSVSLLHQLGCSSLFFGSENGRIEPFIEAAESFGREEQNYNIIVKEELKKGVSYPAAASKAFSAIFKENNMLDLSKPNNILGFHYVTAIQAAGSSMKPYTTARIASQYHDAELPDTNSRIASATSIRKAMIEKGSAAVEDFLPEASARELNTYHTTYGLWHTAEDYFSYVKYSLSTLSPQELSQIYEVEEGLEHRILRIIRQARSYHEMMELLKTKRYTWTRLQRMNTHILTRTKKEDMHKLLKPSAAPYIRLLGMTKKGQAYLAGKKKELSAPLVSKLSSISHPALDLEIKAGRIYSLPIKEPLRTMFDRQEFSQAPIRYDEDEKRFLNA
ncbi:nucleotidyltransferase [Bacillus sp. ISL-51]|uniref:nucleotidyltransferase n=1 Tax=Bacteria TaxID=2 RepID=UPI001BED3A60|nr:MULTISPECIES: nucleotidyltransferase [Bacteria]MBT2573472.1 nucleotidyltransferase [Bacillus sp. ISL-51]MBT2633736.1 nucleotidyltransferase [Bacillus sp. ISL-26]MBT2712674.1 nucleotidyltransferase [Pseudomonas sp. ISL-88]